MKQILLALSVLVLSQLSFAGEIKPGDEAPCISLKHLNYSGAEAVRSTCQADFAGKPLVLEFFATWCHYCVENLPTFTKLASQLGGEASFRLESIDENPQDMRDFFKDMDFSKFELGFDYQAEAFDAFGLYGTPTLVVVGPDRKVRLVHVGTIDNEEQMKEIEKAIKQK